MARAADTDLLDRRMNEQPDVRAGSASWCGGYLGGLIAVLWLIFLLALFEGVTLEFPPRGLTFANYLQITSQFFPALRVSLLLGVCAGIVNMVLTIPASYALTRFTFKGQNLLNAFFLAPNMVPAISLALGLLALYSRIGMLDTFWGLVCSGDRHGAVCCGPCSAFHELDPSLERRRTPAPTVARVLGGDPR
jgi:ABC-type spermidine/putrescine transport system permease subunit II